MARIVGMDGRYGRNGLDGRELRKVAEYFEPVGFGSWKDRSGVPQHEGARSRRAERFLTVCVACTQFVRFVFLCGKIGSLGESRSLRRLRGVWQDSLRSQFIEEIPG